jgi:ATP-binding cassette subfamily B protein
MFSEYGRILPYLLPYWRRLALVVALSLLSTLVSLSQPYIAKLIVDEALLKRDLGALVVIAVLMVAATVGGFALGVFSRFRYVRVSADVLFDMRLALYRHLQTLSPRYFARTKMGDIVSRINNDIAEVQRVAADSALSITSNVVFLAGSVAIMIWLNPALFFLTLALVPLCALLLRRYQRRLTAEVREMRERSAEIGSFLLETLTGLRLVSASNAQEHEVSRFRAANNRFIEALMRMQLTAAMTGALPGTALALATAAVFLYGGRHVIEGSMSVGSLVAFMAYYMRLLGPVAGVMGIWTNLSTARASLGRVFELFDARADVVEKPDAVPLEAVRGAISFRDVSFRHDREATVLEGVSFDIPAGSLCVVIGPSGAGKSTIADLIVRFQDPDSGSVLLDGRDLRTLRLADLRREVLLVDQSPILFHATFRENIAYALPSATDEEIRAAARAAAIDDFIAALPKGYDTVAGERGLAISAGERQRIAIARALLNRPSVLVLDEPTAAVDPATESALIDAVIEHMRGRTVVLITHRPSVADRADLVLSLENARVTAIAPAAA